MNRVLVTGGSGFIGQHVLPRLAAQGFEVHSTVYRRRDALPQNNCQWHQMDLLDTTKIAELVKKIQPTHLLHLAWDTTPGTYWHSLNNFQWVQSSLELLQCFHRMGGIRAVFAGTGFEYDTAYGYCKEGLTPIQPNTTYGLCKASLQQLVNQFAQETQLSCAWGRVFFLYGPQEGERRLVAAVIRSLLQQQPAKCSHGNQIRDFLYVKDVANALVMLLESQIQGPVNIASGKPLALKDLILRIAALLEAPHLIQLGAIPAMPNEPPLQVANIDRLTQEVQWQPQYEGDQGLLETIEWWKHQLNA